MFSLCWALEVQTKMLSVPLTNKRPFEEKETNSNKKARVGTNQELEAMKATLESLLKSADDHHEEIRIAAIDAAFDLEERLREAEALRTDVDHKMELSQTERDAATVYLDRYRNSATVEMLKKAGNFETQYEKDSVQITNGLAKLESMKNAFCLKYKSLVADKAATEERVSKLKCELLKAEGKVVTITNFTTNVDVEGC